MKKCSSFLTLITILAFIAFTATACRKPCFPCDVPVPSQTPPQGTTQNTYNTYNSPPPGTLIEKTIAITPKDQWNIIATDGSICFTTSTADLQNIANYTNNNGKVVVYVKQDSRIIPDPNNPYTTITITTWEIKGMQYLN